MGDRSNIVVQDGEHRVWLYGHWMGCAAVEHAAHGLRSDRWDDPQYLAPIIFEHMKQTRRGLGTGYGISGRRYDNQHPILVIDTRRRPGGNGERGTADVWFEVEDGLRITPRYPREAFLAIAETIPPWIPAWSDPGEHDCAYGHFLEPAPAGDFGVFILCGGIGDI